MKKVRLRAQPECEQYRYRHNFFQHSRRGRWKSKFSKPADLIFPNRHGGYIGHDNLIKRQFVPLFEGAAKPKRFTWHGLRHFAVSTWIEAGLAPKTVQTFAGQASLQITMDRYGHLFLSDDHRRAMDQIAKGLFKNV